MLERRARGARADRGCAPAAAGPARARNLGWRAASGPLDRVHRRRLRAAAGLARGRRWPPRGANPGAIVQGPTTPDPARARPAGPVRAHPLDRGARALVRDLQHPLRGRAARPARRLRRGLRRGAGRGHRPRLAGGRARRRARLGRGGGRPPRGRRARGGRARCARRCAAATRCSPSAATRAARADPALGRRPQPEPAPARPGPRRARARPAAAGCDRCSPSPTARDLAAALPALRRRPARGPGLRRRRPRRRLDLAARLASPPPAGALMAVAVIGAGPAGLACARRLVEAGVECDVYERWPGLGGQAATMEVGDGLRIERYYHYLFTSDSIAIDAFEQLGLGELLRSYPSSAAFAIEGRIWPFNGVGDLLRFRPLSPAARLRMGLALLRLQLGRRGIAEYERQTASSWIRAQHGRAGLGARLGAADAGQVRRARRGDLDGLDLGQDRQAPQPPRRRGAPGALHLAHGQLRAPVRGARAADRGRRRPGADRPPRRPAAARRRRAGGRPRRRGLVPARARPPRASTPTARRDPLRGDRLLRSQPRLRRAARPRAGAARSATSTSPGSRRSSTSPRSTSCSSSSAR